MRNRSLYFTAGIAPFFVILALQACGDSGKPGPDGQAAGGNGSGPETGGSGFSFDFGPPQVQGGAGGVPPTKVAACGDGVRDNGEACDDGNGNSADGCSANCDAVEQNFACPTPGVACVSTVKCGDGFITGSETCDDRNVAAGDGCSALCELEAGWACPTMGAQCAAAKCGDGVEAGFETCDDGNATGGDGCSPVCQLESGFKCEQPGKDCVPTVCNDGKKEGTEPCDDGNNVVGDGCNPFCQLEPDCSSGTCKSSCGDGIKLPNDTDECDDGNTFNGDGCSAECKVEMGYTCTDVVSELPATLEVPVTYRDFNRSATNGGTKHPDFEAFSGSGATLNMVTPSLDMGGKPVYTGICEKNNQIGPCPHGNQSTSKANYDQWYRDDPAVNMTTVTKLSLARQPNDTYALKNSAFFPLDGLGWVQAGKENPSGGHNFGFTSEVLYWFEFKGGEVLSFSGDDDVWVFVNGKLAVDLGGLHGATSGSVTLDPATATTLGLVVGSVYKISLFHAERHTNASNFNLTLGGFVTAKSQCVNVCGDGVLTKQEACDLGSKDGQSLNTGAYNTCNANCTLPPRCGDGVVQSASGEACDDGANLTSYSATSGGAGCAPGCKLPHFCGDAQVDSLFGEFCDDGKNDGGYGECAPMCQLTTRCGNGVVEGGEGCDDGNKKSGDGCSLGCTVEVVR